MDIYWLARIKSRYPVEINSGYSKPVYPADTFLQSASQGYQSPWQRERQILSEALTQPEAASESLAQQVFGRQASDEKLHVMHEAGLLAHRYELHRQHQRDINHRMMKLWEELSVARMLTPWELTRQKVDLEKLIVNLESQKRDEDIAFWKDTLKLRQELLAGIREYKAAKQRADIFGSLEPEDG